MLLYNQNFITAVYTIHTQRCTIFYARLHFHMGWFATQTTVKIKIELCSII